ncbi:MAG: ABC transporter permease [Rhodobacterales bacterium]|nr:ABC transporter permease [Rhodobacterales bacterium]
MNVIRQTFEVLRKELLVEWRSPARVSGLFFFALAMLLMVAFASPTEGILRTQAGGTLWISLLLASTRSMDQSWSTEMEHGAAEGMLLWPVEPVAIYYGKALANTAILLAVTVAIFPLMVGLYDVPVRGDLSMLAAIAVMGCAALAAPGTLYGLITAQARGASVLLPLLMFPLVVPALLAASRGTMVVIEGDPMLQGSSWLSLLVAFNAIHWSLSGLFFGRVLEDG